MTPFECPTNAQTLSVVPDHKDPVLPSLSNAKFGPGFYCKEQEEEEEERVIEIKTIFGCEGSPWEFPDL